MIDLRSGFSSALNVRPGEGAALTLLFVTAFFKGTSILFFDTTASTKFLSDYSVDLLPQIYIATAVVSVLLGLAYAKLEKKVEPLTLLKIVLVFLIVVMLGLYVLSMGSDAPWVSMALMVWKDVHWVLIEIQFWAVAGFLFNVRQGKRLFGLAASGDILAKILGGFGMPWIVGLTGTVHLLLIAGSGLCLCLAMLIVVEKTMKDRFVVEDAEQESSHKTLLELCRDRYLRLFFLLSFLSMIGFYLLDYIFYAQVEGVFADETALAGFFGIFFAALSLVNLTTSSVATSRLLSRFGVVAGLIAAPLVASVGLVTAFAAAAALATLGAFLWVVIGTKLLHEVATEAVEAPTFRVLYLPLRPGERLRAQAVRESMVEPVSLAFAGVLLLLLTEVWRFDDMELSYVLLGFAAATIIVALLLRREYVTTLIDTISKRRFASGALSFEDAASIEVLKKGLASNYAVEVISSLRLLEDAGHSSLDAALVEALGHPSKDVRRYALERIEARRQFAAADRLLGLLESESDSDLRGLAVRVFCALREGLAMDLASPLLNSADAVVRKGAMVGLLRYGGLEGVLLAGTRLNELLQSAEAADRAFAAEVIGDVGSPTLNRPLLNLLSDSAVDVRRAALIAAEKVKGAELATAVLDCLQEPALREYATKALIAFGPAALDELGKRLDADESGDANPIRLIRIMGRIQCADSTRRLLGYLDLPNPRLRLTALTELANRSYKAGENRTAEIEKRILSEAERAIWLLDAIRENRKGGDADLLVDALGSDFRACRLRALLLLSFLYPSEVIQDAKEKLFSSHPDLRANGLEVIDNLVSRDLKAVILPLFDDDQEQSRRDRLTKRLPRRNLGDAFGPSHCMTDRGLLPWTRCCAVYLAGKRREVDHLGAVLQATGDDAWVVRETAAWAISELDPDRHPSVAKRLGNDPSPAVRAVVQRWQSQNGPPARCTLDGPANDHPGGGS